MPLKNLQHSSGVHTGCQDKPVLQVCFQEYRIAFRKKLEMRRGRKQT
jgi:hypothetical protein